MSVHTPVATAENGTIVDRSCDIHVTAETSRIARVLVPTSGMPNADAALVVAQRLAARTGASVELLAVFEPRIPPPLAARVRSSPGQCEAPDRRSAAELLRRVRRQRRSITPAVRWPVRFEVGYPPFVIAEIARQTEADIIILGIGREHPDARRLGGETALHVAHFGEVPVLAVARDTTRPMRNALFVAEGETKVDAIRVALAALDRPSRLWVSYPHDSFGAAQRSNDAARHESLVSELCIPPGAQLERTDVDARDATALIRFAEQHEVDLIVMPVRGQSLAERQLIANIAVPVLRASRCSVLAVPERQAREATPLHCPPHGAICASNIPITAARAAGDPMQWIRWFSEIGIDDVPLVGGKNASLGEMLRELAPLGVPVPDGFAITAEGFRHFLRANSLEQKILALLATTKGVADIEAKSLAVRELMLAGTIPPDLAEEIRAAYRELSRRCGEAALEVAIRSSATAEDLPGASFAGAHETMLNVQGESAVLESVRRCFASLYTPRAIAYRNDMGFAHDAVSLSVGVQKMLRTDSAVSGVIFTLDTDTGFRDVVQIDAIYGLGENIVQGRVGPDEFYVHKPTLRQGFKPILWRRLGTKELRLVFDRAKSRHDNRLVPPEERARFCLTDDEVLQLARWALAIEDHYSEKRGQPTPMDIEFAKDGSAGSLFIVQARPETVHAARHGLTFKTYALTERGTVLLEGLAVGEQIASGAARVIADASRMAEFRPGEVLVTESTDPNWEPVLKQASAVITARGGRTSHAAIVARELGIPAIVGAEDAMTTIANGRVVTVSCAEGETGHVYDGALAFRTEEVDPTSLPSTRTRICMNVGDPTRAFKLAMLPNDGVGLARMEFIFASWVRVHPLALTRYDSLPADTRLEVDALTARYADKREYFVDTLAQGIATLTAAFWPRPVILRFSDFKSNEYAHLTGGAAFETPEENPMLGWRGASRYYHPDYKDGFLLEVAAVKRVRETMGLTNLKLMIPFCRTPEEGKKALAVMREGGLVRGEGGLEVYVMAEIPSNVILVDRFAPLFDGFSIGSNDLTQLVLGVDRDSVRVAPLFDERDEAVRRMCAQLIAGAHAAGRTVGICGQAPSDYPEFAAFLVEQGIDSISLNPDAVVRTKRRVAETEARLAATFSVAAPTGNTPGPARATPAAEVAVRV